MHQDTKSALLIPMCKRNLLSGSKCNLVLRLFSALPCPVNGRTNGVIGLTEFSDKKKKIFSGQKEVVVITM